MTHQKYGELAQCGAKILGQLDGLVEEFKLTKDDKIRIFTYILYLISVTEDQRDRDQV